MCTVACGFFEVSGSKRATCNCREQSLQLGDAMLSQGLQQNSAATYYIMAQAGDGTS